MKKIVLIALSLLGFIAVGEEWRDEYAHTWKFSVSEIDRTARITYSPAYKEFSSTVVVPKYVWAGGTEGMNGLDGKRYVVNEITSGAFRGCNNIVEVIIPDIYEECHAYFWLASKAFENCEGLLDVTWKHPGEAQYVDLANVFAGTPFLARQEAYCGNTNRNNAAVISSKKAYGTIYDSNILAFSAASAIRDRKNLEKFYKWTAPKAGKIYFDTWTADCKLEMTAYSPDGETLDSACFGDRLVFKAQKGKTYLISVKGYASDGRGRYTLNWHFDEKDSRGMVVLKLNDGRYDGTLARAPKQFPMPRNQKILSLPTPTRDGYVFKGWYTSSKYKTKVTANTVLKNNATYYAKWVKKNSTITIINDIDNGDWVGITGKPSTGKYKGKTKFLGGDNLYYRLTYEAGSSVYLMARPLPGRVFRRWIVNGDETGMWFRPSSLISSPAAKFTVPSENASARAEFIDANDDYLQYDWAQDAYLEDGDTNIVSWLYSGSYPTCYYAMPKNFTKDFDVRYEYDHVDDCYSLAFVAKEGTLDKPGLRTVKIAVTNQTGMTTGTTINIYGRNRTDALEDGALSGLRTSVKEPYVLTAGVALTADDWHALGIMVNARGGWTLEFVSGVPGLKYNTKTRTYTGVPTKPGTYTVTFDLDATTQTTSKGKITVHTRTSVATATFVVVPLPDWTVGTFRGHTEEPCPRSINYRGEEIYYNLLSESRKVAITVGQDGKYSANIGGAKFAGSGLTYNKDDSGESYSFVTKINGKGTGKDKNKITWEDTLEVVITPPPENRLDEIRPLGGRSIRWRKKGNVTLEARLYARKSPFVSGSTPAKEEAIYQALRQAARAKDYALTGLYLPKQSDYHVGKGVIELSPATDGKKPALKFTFDTYGGVTVAGKFTYKKTTYKFSGTTPLDIQANYKNGSFGGWYAFARFFNGARMLDVSWRFDDRSVNDGTTPENPRLQTVLIDE